MIPSFCYFFYLSKFVGAAQRRKAGKLYKMTGTNITVAVSPSQSTLLGANSIWLEEQSAVPVVWVVK